MYIGVVRQGKPSRTHKKGEMIMASWSRNNDEWKIEQDAAWLMVPGTWKWCPTSNISSVSKYGVIPDQEAVEAIERIYADCTKRAATFLIRVISKSGKESIMEIPEERSGKIWIWTYEANTGKQAIARLKKLYKNVIEISA